MRHEHFVEVSRLQSPEATIEAFVAIEDKGVRTVGARMELAAFIEALSETLAVPSPALMFSRETLAKTMRTEIRLASDRIVSEMKSVTRHVA